MKKLFFTLIMLVAAATTFTACNDGSRDYENPVPDNTLNQLAMTWTPTQIQRDANSAYVNVADYSSTFDMSNDKLTFNPNSTFVYNGVFSLYQDINGSFVLNGSTGVISGSSADGLFTISARLATLNQGNCELRDVTLGNAMLSLKASGLKLKKTNVVQ